MSINISLELIPTSESWFSSSADNLPSAFICPNALETLGSASSPIIVATSVSVSIFSIASSSPSCVEASITPNACMRVKASTAFLVLTGMSNAHLLIRSNVSTPLPLVSLLSFNSICSKAVATPIVESKTFLSIKPVPATAIAAFKPRKLPRSFARDVSTDFALSFRPLKECPRLFSFWLTSAIPFAMIFISTFSDIFHP